MATTINASTSAGLVSTADTSGVLQLQTGGTTALTVNTTGAIGVGTSPSYGTSGQVLTSAGSAAAPTWSTVSASPGGSTTQVQYNSSGAFAGSANLTFDGSNLTASNCYFAPTASITGNVLVGTNSINATYDSSSTAYGSTLRVVAVGDANIYLKRSGSDGAVLLFYKGGTAISPGSVSITASATTYATSSDYRLKENVQPMTAALEKVAMLKPCTYVWKATGEKSQGFIAHELQSIFPDAVSGEKDAVNEDGSIKPQGVDTSFLVATLTAAIQELTARVAALEAK
jgi:hypothetical protein